MTQLWIGSKRHGIGRLQGSRSLADSGSLFSDDYLASPFKAGRAPADTAPEERLLVQGSRGLADVDCEPLRGWLG
jgi:hypothetical protein